MYHTRMFSGSRMYYRMFVKVTDLREGFTTCITLLWFLLSVYFKNFSIPEKACFGKISADDYEIM